MDENGNELPFKDRVQNFPAPVVSCPHFPTPCTDAAGEMILGYVSVKSLSQEYLDLMIDENLLYQCHFILTLKGTCFEQRYYRKLIKQLLFSYKPN